MALGVRDRESVCVPRKNKITAVCVAVSRNAGTVPGVGEFGYTRSSVSGRGEA